MYHLSHLKIHTHTHTHTCTHTHTHTHTRSHTLVSIVSEISDTFWQDHAKHIKNNHTYTIPAHTHTHTHTITKKNN